MLERALPSIANQFRFLCDNRGLSASPEPNCSENDTEQLNDVPDTSDRQQRHIDGDHVVPPSASPNSATNDGGTMTQRNQRRIIQAISIQCGIWVTSGRD